LEEFTDLLNGCSPDALRRNAFAIFRIVCMARYFLLKTQEVHEALQKAHLAMGLAKINPEGATDEVGNQSAADRPGLTEQDAASAARQQEALASAAAHAERARVAEHSNTELRGQLAQAQGQLTQVIHEATVAIEQVRAHAADLDDRLKASVASERDALARSSQTSHQTSMRTSHHAIKSL
jgi:hypothetical protein